MDLKQLGRVNQLEWSKLRIWLGRCGRVGMAGLILGVSVYPSREALAKKSSFLETVGISILAGTVIGASTLPFYETPEDHLRNLAWGAGAGAIVGLGVWAYTGLFSSDSVAHRKWRRDFELVQRPVPRTSHGVWMPVVSLNW